jgi:hypothetical protein
MPRNSSPLLLAAAFVATAATATARPAPPQPVPGTVGLTMKEVPIRNSCSKTFVQVKKVKPGDDPALIAVLTHPRITGLDMDPEKKARTKASLEKFNHWFQTLTTKLETANAAQQKLFAEATTPAAKAEAAARMSFVLDQSAHLIEAAEIPVNIRKMPEAAEVYCDTLFEKTEPLRAKAKEAREACAKVITDSKLTDGWFLAVCTPPAAAPATQPTTPAKP